MCCKGDETSGCGKLCLILLAFFLPPLAVFLNRGCGEDFCINMLLTLLGWIPGVIHAMYIIVTDRDKDEVMTEATTTTTTTTTAATPAPEATTAAPAATPAPAPAAVSTTDTTTTVTKTA